MSWQLIGFVLAAEVLIVWVWAFTPVSYRLTRIWYSGPRLFVEVQPNPSRIGRFFGIAPEKILVYKSRIRKDPGRWFFYDGPFGGRSLSPSKRGQAMLNLMVSQVKHRPYCGNPVIEEVI